MNKAQVEAGQKRIDYIRDFPTDKINGERLGMFESMRLKIDESDPNALSKIQVEGVRRMPKD